MHTFELKIDRSIDSCVRRSLVWLGFTFTACGSTPQEAVSLAPLTVAVTSAERVGSYTRTQWLTGQVRSQRASRLGFERSGLVQALLVDEGDRVRKGQAVARLDVRQLQAARRRLKSALRRAEAQRGLSELTSKRLSKLAAASFTPEQQADEARFGTDAARATVDELQANLAQIQIDIEKSVLRAPFAGTVSDRLVDEGTVVAAGTPVVRLMGQDRKEAFVGVPIASTSDLEPGSEVDVELSGGATLTARVEGLIDDVDVRTRTVGVVLTLPPEVEATDGQVVRLAIRREVSVPGFWLPTTALTPGLRGLWTVLVVREGVVDRASVQVEHVEGRRVFVAGTLRSGDAVVREGQHRVVPGQKVTVSAGGAR